VRDKDPQYDIRSGQLKLAGEDVAKFFEPSVEAIADAFEKQQQAAMRLQIQIKHAFLVGGYAASDFLYRSLQLHPAFSEVQLCRPSSQVNKAVADGAVSSYIAPLVTSRTSKCTYGVECIRRYDQSLFDHRQRKQKQFTVPSGAAALPNAFASILQRGVQVSEQQEFRHPFIMECASRSELNSLEDTILAYRGDLLDPQWMDEEPARFTNMCTVVANTSKLVHSLQPQVSPDGIVYYHLEYEVILLFGLSELKAQISWMHKGVEKRSPASIVYTD